MKHTPLDSQACQRQAIAHGKLCWQRQFNTDSLTDMGYCIDAPDLLLAETLHSSDYGGCSFQWTVDRG